MQLAIGAILRSPQGIGLLLVLAGCALLRPNWGDAGTAQGPAYDLIFGVYVFDPNQNAAVMVSPYVLGGKVYMQAEKLPVGAGTQRVAIYRYHSQTGVAEPLPLPSDSELLQLVGKQFAFKPTEQMALSTQEKSPDGYALTEPQWVKVGPVSQAIGNVAMFLVSGGFGPIKKRENSPRLSNGTNSIAMKAKRPILQNESDTAFLLGWVVPATVGNSGKN